MIFVGTGMFPPANDPDAMKKIEGPGPEARNRVGSFIGPISASFQVDPPAAPSKGDGETAEAYGQRVAGITLKFIRGRQE
jgi:hypothetical protein